VIEPPRIEESSVVEAAVIHLTIPREQMQAAMGPAFGELMATFQAQGLAPAGPAFAHHLRMEPGTWDFELGFPVARPVTPAGRVAPGRLPAATVARTVYHGPYEGLAGAWGELMAWVEAQGRRAAPDLWEIYLTDPRETPSPANYRTELVRPLVG
jgi:effector-binding domain-containing protein